MKKGENTQVLIMRTVEDYSTRRSFEEEVNEYLEKGYKVANIKMSSGYNAHTYEDICHIVVVLEKQNKTEIN